MARPKKVVEETTEDNQEIEPTEETVELAEDPEVVTVQAEGDAAAKKVADHVADILGEANAKGYIGGRPGKEEEGK